MTFTDEFSIGNALDEHWQRFGFPGQMCSICAAVQSNLRVTWNRLKGANLISAHDRLRAIRSFMLLFAMSVPPGWATHIFTASCSTLALLPKATIYDVYYGARYLLWVHENCKYRWVAMTNNVDLLYQSFVALHNSSETTLMQHLSRRERIVTAGNMLSKGCHN